MMQYREFLAILARYAEREYAVECANYYALKNSTLEEQIANPACIATAELISDQESYTASYMFSDEGVKFRIEDDLHIIDRETGHEFKATVLGLNVLKKTITFDCEDLDEMPRKALIVAPPFPPNKNIKKRIDHLAFTLNSYPHIFKLLTREPNLPTAKKSNVTDMAGKLTCSNDIARILCVASAMDHTTLAIQGPPGTGKTYVAAMLAVELMCGPRAARIGIMSQTHAGINNLCYEIESIAKKYNRSFKGIKRSNKNRDCLESDGCIRDVEKIGNDAGFHNLSAGTPRLFSGFDHKIFDYLIIDEASQLSLSEVIASAMCARNLIIVGDQQQLPQVNKAHHPMGSDVSAMNYFLDQHAVVPENRGFFLSQTRRMNADITGLISALSYDHFLQPHPIAKNRRLEIIEDPSDPLGPCGFYFLSVPHSGLNQESLPEAEAIHALVTRLEKSVPLKEIMVVTPYRAQENLLRSLLPAQIRLGTADKIQGQEADVVFYSMASSDIDMGSEDLDFLLSLNRLNVALSRGRKKSILVCSEEIFKIRADSIKKIRLLNALAYAREYHFKLQKEYSHVIRRA